MTKRLYFFILVAMLFFSGCVWYIPTNVDSYERYRVILLVEPDDAEVLLDGRQVGLAYEFSTRPSALRLSSLEHELVVKKRGYDEESVNLRQFNSSKITIRLVLKRKDTRYTTGEGIEKVPQPELKEPKPEYMPRPEAKEPPVKVPEPEMPPETEAEEPEEEGLKVEPVQVNLTIEPAEASIYLDGKFWGISPAEGKIDMWLKPGKYALEVVKPGFQPFRKEHELKDGKKVQLNIELKK